MSASSHGDAWRRTAVAIIGLAGRFPGAADIDVFWRNTAAGARAIRPLTGEELEAAGVEPALLQDPRYVKVGAPIEGVELFDAEFFGIPPREAETMDPQHRLFLECAWEALECAGYDSELHNGPIGVFAGAASSGYLWSHIQSRRDVLQTANRMQVSMHNEVDSLATTVSYRLNLRGPAVAVQTFCSSSLVAVHLACQSLLTYDCGLALAGGVAIAIPQGAGYIAEVGGILSPEGRCRAFDAQGTGSVMGNGLGVVVLKRLEDALADGDEIWAVIRGSAMNNDGARKVGYTAPGLMGQASVIARALVNASVTPDEIDYIETHGTGTALGDAVELAAMTKAFRQRTARTGYCAIGSVKPAIGHLDRAAGVTGLIRATLALRYAQMPPSLDFERASPEVELDVSPFVVNTRLRPWARGAHRRRAGVSSFGVGGTNVHVVLEEAPAIEEEQARDDHHLLLLSAKSAAALDRAAERLLDHLRAHPDASLASVAYTLQVGRRGFNHRRALVCRDREETLAALAGASSASEIGRIEQVQRNPPIVFRVPAAPEGVALGRLGAAAPKAFCDAVEQCCAQLDASRGSALRAALLGSDRRADGPLAAFAAGFATAALLRELGVQPVHVIGEGGGEILAANLRGALRLDEALRRVASGEGSGGRDSRDVAVAGAPVVEPDALVIEIGPGAPTGDAIACWSPSQPPARALLAALGRLWLAGVKLDFSALHRGAKRRRARLPTYPFERQRYWIDRGPNALGKDTPPGEPERCPDIADWFYVPSWRRSAAPEIAASPPNGAEVWVLFVDTGPLGDGLAAALRSRGHAVVTVRRDPAPSAAGRDDYTMREAARDDYRRMLDALVAEGRTPAEIVYLWSASDPRRAGGADGSSEDGSQDTALTSLISLFALSQALGDRTGEACRLTVVASSMFDVLPGERPDPSHAMLVAPCRVLPHEYPHLACRAIDIGPTAGADPAILVGALLRELLEPGARGVVALRGDQRWIECYEPVPLRSRAPESVPLREGGVYLITGGLGGIGLAMAEHLCRTLAARLVLVGRTGLPPRERWAELSARPDTDERVRRRVRAVLNLEACGSEVLVVEADVADPVAARRAVRAAIDRFGTLHGVLHAAGLPGVGVTSRKTLDAVRTVLGPKVLGTLALWESLEGVPADFLLLFSSVATATGGGAGQLDYCAANVFLDAWARKQPRRSTRVVSAAWGEWLWDAWQEGLLGFPAEVRAAYAAFRAKFGITFEEGAEAFRRILASGLSHVYVSTCDLSRAAAESQRNTAAYMMDELRRRRAARPRYRRPLLNVSFQEPRTDLERSLASLWSEILGIEPVGIDDSFFELGGNSLIGIDLVARLRTVPGSEGIGVQVLYEAPTVRTLASRLAGEGTDPVAKASVEADARANQRRERLQRLRRTS